MTLAADASVSARFDSMPPPGRELTVVVVGQGRITSSPAGIDCTATYTASFADVTSVTLTAAPASGWQFATWSGACSSTDCALTLTADAKATASFTQVAPPSVSIAPATASVISGGTLHFTATVAGTADQSVLWSTSEGQDYFG